MRDGWEGWPAQFKLYAAEHPSPALPVQRRERLLDGRVLERIADARDDLVAQGLIARLGKRRLRIACMLLALAAELLDQRVAVAFETGIDRRRSARGLGRLGDRCIELTLRRQAQRHGVLGRDVRHVPVRAVADRGDSRARRADQLADLAVADFRMVLDDPRDSVRLVLTLGHRRVTRAARAADFFGGADHLEPVLRIGLAAL